MCERTIGQLTPQWRAPITVLKWIGHRCFSIGLSSALLTQRPVGKKNQNWELSREAVQSDPRVTESMCLWQSLRWEWGASEIAGCFYTQRLGFPRYMRNPRRPYGKFHRGMRLEWRRCYVTLGFSKLWFCFCIAHAWRPSACFGGHFVTFSPVPGGLISSSASSRISLFRYGRLFLHNCSQFEPIQ